MEEPTNTEAVVVEEEIQTPEVAEYREFLSSIWNHSLLDDRTRGFREECKLKLKAFFDERGINDGYIAVPVGSAHSLVDDKSDFDIVLFLDDDASRKWREIPFLEEGLKERNIDIREISNVFNKWNYPKAEIVDIAFAMLMCPDKYIAGDVHTLRGLRLTTIDVLGDEKLWRLLDGRFEGNIRRWHDENSPAWMMPNKGPKKGDRTSRLERVKVRAKELDIDYLEWVSYREQLEMLPAETITEAIKATEGRLVLSE